MFWRLLPWLEFFFREGGTCNAGPVKLRQICQYLTFWYLLDFFPVLAELWVMETKNDNYQKGLALLETLHGGQSGEQLVQELGDVCPDFVDMTLEWALAGIMGRPGLDLPTRELLLVASCVTIGGGAEPQLGAHIDAALKVG